MIGSDSFVPGMERVGIARGLRAGAAPGERCGRDERDEITACGGGRHRAQDATPGLPGALATGDERRDRVAHGLIVIHAAVHSRTRRRGRAVPPAAGTAQLLHVRAPAVSRKRRDQMPLHAEQRRLAEQLVEQIEPHGRREQRDRGNARARARALARQGSCARWRRPNDR